MCNILTKVILEALHCRDRLLGDTYIGNTPISAATRPATLMRLNKKTLRTFIVVFECRTMSVGRQQSFLLE